MKAFCLNMASSYICNPKLLRRPCISSLHATPSSSILSPSTHPFQPLKFNHHNSKRLSSYRPKVASPSSSSSTPTPSRRRTTIPKTKNREQKEREEKEQEQEQVFFDGGAHYGDLVANVVFGFSLLWLPLTMAAVFRALFLRYRFTNVRVTVISGFTGSDRRDFSYSVIKDVQVVPRLIGEWGDIIITLTDGTKVDLRSVPRFREIAGYCLFKAGKSDSNPLEEDPNDNNPLEEAAADAKSV